MDFNRLNPPHMARWLNYIRIWYTGSFHTGHKGNTFRNARSSSLKRHLLILYIVYFGFMVTAIFLPITNQYDCLGGGQRTQFLSDLVRGRFLSLFLIVIQICSLEPNFCHPHRRTHIFVAKFQQYFPWLA